MLAFFPKQRGEFLFPLSIFWVRKWVALGQSLFNDTCLVLEGWAEAWKIWGTLTGNMIWDAGDLNMRHSVMGT